MNTIHFKLLVPLIVLVFTSHSSLASPPTPTQFRSLGEIQIKGLGGWDDLSLDSANHLLFVSHSDRVVVIDISKNKVIKEITGTQGVHGIAIASELGKAFSSNGKDNSVGIIQLDSLNLKAKIAVGENPDAILYDPGKKEVYVFNGRSKTASIINALTEKVVATLSLPGKPEFTAVDSEAKRVYVNIEDKNSIVAIDTEKHRIASDWKIEHCESPSGLAIDVSRHRLFTVCENSKMVMLDSTTGKNLATIETGEGTDGAAFDPELQLVFSPNGKSATITIVRETSNDTLTLVQSLPSVLGARTITIDPAHHKIYLPTADLRQVDGQSRPRPVDGTQRVLVYGPK